MLWTTVKTWAKDNGYTTFREKSEKTDKGDNAYDYYWAKDSDPTVRQP